jgi:hypothetical protein
MPKIVLPARYGVAMFAALASLAVVAAPAQKALGDKPSTPVSVINPSTAPALTSSIDNPGRIAYQSEATVTCTTSSSCQFSFPAVPQGHHLVVQHVSGSLSFSITPDTIEVVLSGTAAGTTNSTGASQFFAPSVDNLSLFDQPVLYYIDGGISPVVSVIPVVPGSGGCGSQTCGAGTGKVVVTFTTNPQSVTLTGYLLDCTASPCAAIAQ